MKRIAPIRYHRHGRKDTPSAVLCARPRLLRARHATAQVTISISSGAAGSAEADSTPQPETGRQITPMDCDKPLPAFSGGRWRHTNSFRPAPSSRLAPRAGRRKTPAPRALGELRGQCHARRRLGRENTSAPATAGTQTRRTGAARRRDARAGRGRRRVRRRRQGARAGRHR